MTEFKKETMSIIVKVICFGIIGIIILHVLTKILIPKWITPEDNRMSYIVGGFYEEPKNSLDVIFMGNSDVYRGISPITMWDEYGITSYNYSTSGQRMWTEYYLLEECIKTQTPRLIVLNMDSAFNETQSSESNYRKTFDNMKLSINKIRAITDPVFKNKKEEILSYIFPIARFHSRWAELEDVDFEKAFESKKFAYKGMDISVDTKAYVKDNEYMKKDDSKEKIGEKCYFYLNKIIATCKKNNIELLLIELPSAESWSYDLSEKTQEFANNKGLDFIDLNLNYKDFGFDWNTDSADGGDHLNVYGAEKVSKYIGKIIQEKYNIPNRKQDLNCSAWYENSKKYHEDIKKMEKNLVQKIKATK